MKQQLIALRIKKILLEKGISQKQLAFGIGADAASICRLLTGEYNFTVKTIERIEKYLQTDIITVP